MNNNGNFYSEKWVRPPGDSTSMYVVHTVRTIDETECAFLIKHIEEEVAKEKTSRAQKLMTVFILIYSKQLIIPQTLIDCAKKNNGLVKKYFPAISFAE